MGSPQDSAHHALSDLAGRRTVLVVDDEQSVRELIAVILELDGHRVLQAESGPVALEVVAAEHVDLITLDVMMPGLDGWQVAASLDADADTARIPRVMVSGKPLVELRAAAGCSRASAVLTKPFDFAELTEVVRGLLAAPAPLPGPRVSSDRPRLVGSG